ncbi:hypothetical protein F511_27820 [Dorcoceras hygrometricum]|uniref:Uncharacterized protein n=1 Tax=Dorcoceras hygrometricum TaxID=472368 RepID=A0A2Z7D9X9_9LAMI|nr:hypothetical protein F511_27820 [Dorcoceras hygrometricum]
MGPTSNIGPKTSWAARDRPELNLEEKFSRRNNLPEIIAVRPPPPCCMRRLAARLPQQVRRMALVAPTSGATFIFWPAIIAQQLNAKQQHHTAAARNNLRGQPSASSRPPGATSAPLSLAAPASHSATIAQGCAAMRRDHHAAVRAIARRVLRRRMSGRPRKYIFYFFVQSIQNHEIHAIMALLY